jgi:hypothetical protein
VAGILHFFLLFVTIRTTLLVLHDLIHLIHRVREGVEVPSTNNEDLSLLNTDLNGLEVMWEVVRAVDNSGAHVLRNGVENVEFP